MKDGKEFFLGLSDLRGTDERSANAIRIDDFGVFLVNFR